MKTTILKISFIFLLFSLMGAGCEKEDAPLKKGKIVFYTNAQAILNCGPFNVDIFINKDSVGSIYEPFIEGTYPECINSSATLVVEEKTGKYNYTAKMDCSQYGSWVNEVEVYPDSCVYIFLDIDYCIIKKIKILNYEKILFHHRLLIDTFKQLAGTDNKIRSNKNC